MKKILLLFIVNTHMVLAACTLVCAADVPDRPTGVIETEASMLFEEANRLYEGSEFDQAIKKYKEVLYAGLDSGEVHYNLGNAYFKNGQLGGAILHYRKALLQMPRDADLLENLEYARLLTVDRVVATHGGALDMLISFANKLRPGDWALCEGILFALFCICLCIFFISSSSRARRFFRAGAVVSILLAVASGATSLALQHQQSSGAEAVIVSPRVEVYSGPGSDFSTTLILHEGTEVKIIDHRTNWYRILIPGNKKGWVIKDMVSSV